MRYFAELSYKGTNYHGWQIQPNAKTVQETIENNLYKLLRTKINIIGCGRTDTGVHSSFFVMHFDYEKTIDEKQLTYKLNKVLPHDIAIHKIYEVNQDAHARFDAISRTYQYFIQTEKNPFNKEFSYYYTQALDLDLMNEAANKLFNYTDFTSFSKLHTDVFTNNCKIMNVKWEKTNNQLIFTIKADRFLRNMVRAIVGTLIEVGKKKISIKEFCEIIESKNRCKAGTSVPGEALFLSHIEYPKKILPK